LVVCNRVAGLVNGVRTHRWPSPLAKEKVSIGTGLMVLRGCIGGPQVVENVLGKILFAAAD
jgi:hypothetical protein